MMAVEEDAVLGKRRTHAGDKLADVYTDEVVVDEHADRSTDGEKETAQGQSVPHSDFGDDVVARYA